ncbi:MAG TPA: glycine cleavage system protein H [Planctomycetaceae bacterium]|nr:glycine cleavage system protein H [Planctomycetaceae bacterium]
MAKPLVFMMGTSPAILPVDRLYTTNHMWAQEAVGGWRFGFSSYAVRLLGEIHHVQWSVAPGGTVHGGQQIGFIEGSKATSDLYAPCSGTLVEANADVLARPALINSNPYDRGWLLVVDTAAEFLSPQAYLAHLEACWPLAQRLLKGQARRS